MGRDEDSVRRKPSMARRAKARHARIQSEFKMVAGRVRRSRRSRYVQHTRCSPFRNCPPAQAEARRQGGATRWPTTITGETPPATDAQENSSFVRSVARLSRRRPTRRERPSQRRRNNSASPKAADVKKGSARNTGRTPSAKKLT